MLELEFRVKADAPPGPAAVDLQFLSVNDGRIVQAVPSVPGADPTDAAIDVPAPLPPAPPLLRSASPAGRTSATATNTAGTLPTRPKANVPAVTWDKSLATEPGPVLPAATAPTIGSADWMSTPWAKDLVQRLPRISTGEGMKGGLLRALAAFGKERR